jgi:hypothetical protein
MIDHEEGHRRRQRAAPAAEGPHHGLRLHALADRQPSRQHAGEIGKAARFARAEQETHDPQRGQIPHRAMQRQEGRPGQHQLAENPAHAQLVAKQAHGNFEQRIGKTEGAQDHALLRLAEVQLQRDRHNRLADRHPLNVHDHRQGQREDDDPIARVRGFHCVSPLLFSARWCPFLGLKAACAGRVARGCGLHIGRCFVY